MVEDGEEVCLSVIDRLVASVHPERRTIRLWELNMGTLCISPFDSAERLHYRTKVYFCCRLDERHIVTLESEFLRVWLVDGTCRQRGEMRLDSVEREFRSLCAIGDFDYDTRPFVLILNEAFPSVSLVDVKRMHFVTQLYLQSLSVYCTRLIMHLSGDRVIITNGPRTIVVLRILRKGNKRKLGAPAALAGRTESGEGDPRRAGPKRGDGKKKRKTGKENEVSTESKVVAEEEIVQQDAASRVSKRSLEESEDNI